MEQLKIRGQMVGMTNDERRIQEAINQVTNETSRKIDDITKKREDAAGRGGMGKVVAEYDNQIAMILSMQETYIEMARNIETATIQSQRTFEFGWDKAFNQFAENAFNYATIAEQAFRSITDNMLSALDNFVDTGKFKFSDFASSVIKDLIKIQLRAQATQLMSKFIGGAGSFLGSFMGGGGGGPAPLGNMGGAGFTTAADGGHISGPTLVGENGPEIFIPQRSGTVIPNQQLSSMGNNQPQVVYNGPVIQNMSAIDTQSGLQFLAKNKNAVWSANQSASRGLPASRS
jgi:lambda family phage tail tape measure protein